MSRRSEQVDTRGILEEGSRQSRENRDHRDGHTSYETPAGSSTRLLSRYSPIVSFTLGGPLVLVYVLVYVCVNVYVPVVTTGKRRSERLKMIDLFVVFSFRREARDRNTRARAPRRQHRQRLPFDRGLDRGRTLQAGISRVPQRDDALSHRGRGLLREGFSLRTTNQSPAAALRKDFGHECVSLFHISFSILRSISVILIFHSKRLAYVIVVYFQATDWAFHSRRCRCRTVVARTLRVTLTRAYRLYASLPFTRITARVRA